MSENDSASAAGAAKKKILIIDDDDMLRETLKIALNYASFEIADSGDSEQAFALARGGKPDVILLDLYMPGVSGVDILKRLKSETDTALIPVIIFTGSGEIKDVTEAIGAGAFDYIVKPVDSRLLLEKIRRALKINPRP